MTETSRAFRKSTYSGYNADCVEVASGILVRDTADRGGAALSFPAQAWAEFTAAVKP